MLKYKEDWDDAQKRFIAWWNGEIIDRVMLSVTAPREKPIEVIPEVPAPATLLERWTNVEYKVKSAEWHMARTFYGGEAFPYFFPYLGPGTLANYLGSEPVFAEDTVWYSKCIDDPDNDKPLRFNPRNKWWKLTVEMYRLARERGRGKYLVAYPDLIENLDVYASLRGTNDMLLDVFDRPQFIHRKQREILKMFCTYFEKSYDIIKEDDGGSCFIFEIWGPGKTAKVQCDASAMLSPAQFREFVVPYLAEQCSWLDFSGYHLDGPPCVQHLDALLEIDSLQAIQWTPGPQTPCVSSPAYFPMYKRIKDAGKNVMILGAKPNEIEPLIRAMGGPERLLISTSVPTEQEAKDLLKAALKWR